MTATRKPHKQSAKLYLIEHQRQNGDWRPYERYKTRPEAEEVLKLLRWCGAAARIVVEPTR